MNLFFPLVVSQSLFSTSPKKNSKMRATLFDASLVCSQHTLIKLLVGVLREVISEVVHDFLPLIFDFLSAEASHERWALIFDCLDAEGIVAIYVSDLKFSDGFDWNRNLAAWVGLHGWINFGSHRSRRRRSKFCASIRRDKFASCSW